MSDPLAMQENLTGMLTNGSFGEDRDDPSTGEGGDVETDGIEIEGEPDTGPDEIEPGQD